MNALDKYFDALGHLADALTLLREIGTSNALYYAAAVDQLISCDDGEAGLQPFIQRLSGEQPRATPDEQMYMNMHTGSVGPRQSWYYETEDGLNVNAVDAGEVVPVTWNARTRQWESQI